MVYVFVLKLRDGKFYVGNCADKSGIRALMKQRRTFNLKWLNEYPPLEILNVYNNADIFDLDKLTKQMMAAHGIENVRGGAYEEYRLSSSDKIHIEKEIFSALGMCMHCGSNMHRTVYCERRTLKWKINNLIKKIKSKICYFQERGTDSEKRQLIQNSYRNVNQQNLMDELSLSESPELPPSPVMTYKLKNPTKKREVMDSLDSLPESPPPSKALMYSQDIISPIFEPETESVLHPQRTPSPLISPGIRPIDAISPPPDNFDLEIDVAPGTPIITMVPDKIDLSEDERANRELRKPIRKLLDSDDGSLSITPENERVILFEAKLTESAIVDPTEMKREVVEEHPLLDI